ncbi:flavoprotein, partial [Acidianus sp. RZ1]
MVHPSRKIISSISSELEGYKLLLGVSSSISLYKTIDLCRELMRRGADVKVIMTKSASKLISPDVFKWATGNEVITHLTGGIEHVELSEEFNALIIAPATANIITKMAYGMADNALLATALNFIGKKKPIILVPAMHLPMYESPQVRDSIQKLKDFIEIIEPSIVNDLAHYPDLEYLISRIIPYVLRGKDLKGMKIIVTAGPTR